MPRSDADLDDEVLGALCFVAFFSFCCFRLVGGFLADVLGVRVLVLVVFLAPSCPFSCLAILAFLGGDVDLAFDVFRFLRGVGGEDAGTDDVLGGRARPFLGAVFFAEDDVAVFFAGRRVVLFGLGVFLATSTTSGVGSLSKEKRNGISEQLQDCNVSSTVPNTYR